MTRKFVSYLRVSTNQQGQSGLGLQAQQNSVQDFIKQSNSELIDEFVEVESGRKSDRPQLAEALKMCKRTGATLLIAKLDRLARNVAFVANLMESGTEFLAVDNPHASKTMLQMMSVFAEFERDQISERTKSALAQAKARGVKLGGRRTADQYERSSRVTKAGADQFAENIRPVIAQIQASGLTTYKDIAGALNARGVATRRGGQWYATTVRNIVTR